MTKEQYKEVTPDISKNYNQQDRRFKASLVAFAIFFTLMMGIVLYLGVVTVQNLSFVITKQTETLERMSKSAEDRTRQIRDLQNHINCVVALFQKSDREQLVISDIENCDIKRLKASSPKPTDQSENAPQIAQNQPQGSEPKANKPEDRPEPVTRKPPTSSEPPAKPQENKGLVQILLEGIFGKSNG